MDLRAVPLVWAHFHGGCLSRVILFAHLAIRVLVSYLSFFSLYSIPLDECKVFQSLWLLQSLIPVGHEALALHIMILQAVCTPRRRLRLVDNPSNFTAWKAGFWWSLNTLMRPMSTFLQRKILCQSFPYTHIPRAKLFANSFFTMSATTMQAVLLTLLPTVELSNWNHKMPKKRRDTTRRKIFGKSPMFIYASRYYLFLSQAQRHTLPKIEMPSKLSESFKDSLVLFPTRIFSSDRRK